MTFRSNELTRQLNDMVTRLALSETHESDLNKESGDNATTDSDVSGSGGSMGSCERCSTQINDWKSDFYICGEYSCARKSESFVCC